MEPVLSIITVTYNCRDLLPRTLESVRGQTFSAIEHVLVDGASTDGTLELIREYQDAPAGKPAHQDENPAHESTWISEPDKGIYDAMNKGLRMARGRYVLFLNAGDTFYSPDTVRLIFDGDQHAPAQADIYYGQTKITDMQGRITGDRRLRAPRRLTWKSFRYGMLVCHQSFIVRRAIAPQYDLSWRICADIDWCIRCMKAAKEIRNTQLYISCFLEGGFSGQRERQAWKERFAIMRKYYGTGSTLISHVYIVLRYISLRRTPK